MAEKIEAYFNPGLEVAISNSNKISIKTKNKKIKFKIAIVFENTENNGAVEATLQVIPFTIANREIVTITDNACEYHPKSLQSKMRIILLTEDSPYCKSINDLVDMKILPRVYTTEVLFLKSTKARKNDPVWVDIN